MARRCQRVYEGAALFVSVLMHGNEPTGWEAVRRVLQRYMQGDEPQLPRALSLFIANTAAAAEGKVLRYVARLEDGQCRVSIEAVDRAGPLGAIRDGENALVIHSRYYQPIPMVLRGYGAGAAVTAAGVFGDLLRTAWRPLDL